MVQYRFAKRTNGSIVDVQIVADSELSKDAFLCIGCDRPLIAKVKGEKRQPHFAHHPGTICSRETYLHLLGKQVFFEVFNECLANELPFEIELRHPSVCRRFQSSLGSACVLERFEFRLHDLTNHFNQIVMEAKDGDFVPDLLLTNDSGTGIKVYVEIAVTHFLTEQKASSNERIIEIPISSEEDVERIRSRKLTWKTARFINFVTESQMLVDSDCRCGDRTSFAFFVFKNGECTLEKSTLAGLVSKRQKHGDAVAYFRLFCQPEQSQIEYMPVPGPILRKAIAQASSEGFPLKNCYLCKHQGDNFARDSTRPILCTHFNKTCSYNEAVTCTVYQPHGPR